MRLETDRLILRSWYDSDAEELYKYAQNPQVGPVAGWPPHQSVEESLENIRTVFSYPETYAVVLKETGKPIGCIGLKTRNATDLTEMVRHAFEDCGMMKVWVGYYDGNNRSKRVQEKCGFKYQWTTDNVDVPLMHETRKGHVSSLTKEEWMIL